MVGKLPRISLYRILIRALRAARNAFMGEALRRILFDVAAPNSFLVHNGPDETFVISSSDRAIGREIYASDQPYDLNKLVKCLEIIGGGKRRVLIDVGANIGTICIPAVKRNLFQTAIAVEPEPLNFSLLLANMHLNRVADKITALNIALGERDDEQLLLELSEFNFGDHRIRRAENAGAFHETGRKTISVRSDTFDKVVKELAPHDSLVWMDTQGFEGHILSGARNALRLCPPICLEFWPYAMNRVDSYESLKRALLDNNYKEFFDLNKPPAPRPLTAETLDDLYNEFASGTGYTEILIR